MMTASAPDFTYTQSSSDGFVCLMPENERAIEAYNIIASTIGGYRLLPQEFKTIRQDLRKAGYTVRKAASVNMSDDDLLSELL